MENLDRLIRTLKDIFGGIPTGVREFRQVGAVEKILVGGSDPKTAASEFKLKWQPLAELAERFRQKDLAAMFPLADLTSETQLHRRRLGIAQMLLGALAERRFEELIGSIAGHKVRIEDHRPSRTDTDYRLLNGGGHPVCRFNIKFHGTLFRASKDYVGLEPEDCFALAAYKINNAIKRQTAEALPYIFVILSIPDLNAGDLGKLIPMDYVWTLAVFGGKRVLEEAIVERLRSPDYIARFRSILSRMPDGEFRVISAAKANLLLREKLFERVHALTVKSFTRTFRNAEVDMHLSLSTELTPVRTFIEDLIARSPQEFAVRLYRGDF